MILVVNELLENGMEKVLMETRMEMKLVSVLAFEEPQQAELRVNERRPPSG